MNADSEWNEERFAAEKEAWAERERQRIAALNAKREPEEVAPEQKPAIGRRSLIERLAGVGALIGGLVAILIVLAAGSFAHQVCGKPEGGYAYRSWGIHPLALFNATQLKKGPDG